MNGNLKPNKPMNTVTKTDDFKPFHDLVESVGLSNTVIRVVVINPIRKEEHYKEGRMTGFKSGLMGGGHYNYKNGIPNSFDSRRIHWLKKPKVHVTYDIFEFHGREHSDWIDLDNCLFKTQNT
jgi:hypothetical protein